MRRLRQRQVNQYFRVNTAVLEIDTRLLYLMYRWELIFTDCR